MWLCGTNGAKKPTVFKLILVKTVTLLALHIGVKYLFHLKVLFSFEELHSRYTLGILRASAVVISREKNVRMLLGEHTDADTEGMQVTPVKTKGNRLITEIFNSLPTPHL